MPKPPPDNPTPPTEPIGWLVDGKFYRARAALKYCGQAGKVATPLVALPSVKPGEPHVPSVVVSAERLEKLEAFVEAYDTWMDSNEALGILVLQLARKALESKGEHDGKPD